MMLIQPISRDVARAQGAKRFFTGKPCKHGHVSARMVSSQQCVECNKTFGSAWKKAHRTDCSATKRQWCEKNRDKVREIKRSYYANNEVDRENQAARARKWLEANREKSRAASANWRRNNLAQAAAAQQRRRAKKLQRTPTWADHEKILQFYILSKELTEQTGIEHEVDHIYPLQGEFVSGLHVETNLQVIPKQENRSKGARLLGQPKGGQQWLILQTA
jgi:hypothetical protein